MVGKQKHRFAVHQARLANIWGAETVQERLKIKCNILNNTVVPCLNSFLGIAWTEKT